MQGFLSDSLYCKKFSLFLVPRENHKQAASLIKHHLIVVPCLRQDALFSNPV